MNLYKAIPTLSFPENKIPVSNPKEEQMVYLNEYFLCDSKYYKWEETNGEPLPGSSPYIMARESVLKMLKEAESLLPQGYKFKIYDAYRPIAVQQSLWDYYKAKKKEENPDKTEEEINKLTAFCVSFPSYNILEPSLHNTGGAVDLTIVDPYGNELDMGCKFDEFTDKAWTNHFECFAKNDTVKMNRRLLYNVMTAVGFTNLPSEWWHFDYGNDKWAQFNKTAPFYAGVLDAKVKNTVPYKNEKQIQLLDEKQQNCIKDIPKIFKTCKNLAVEFVKTQKEQEFVQNGVEEKEL